MERITEFLKAMQEMMETERSSSLLDGSHPTKIGHQTKGDHRRHDGLMKKR
jgi:hypothetical protein